MKKEIDKILDYIFSNPTPLVYFIRCNEYVKIGRSVANKIDRRLMDIRIGNPYKIEFESLVMGDRKVEKGLHKFLKKFRERGEWFKLNKKEVGNVISELKLTRLL